MTKKLTIRTCAIDGCENEFYLSDRRSKYCSKECSKKYSKSPEWRTKLSNSRKKFLKENPDKHPWKLSTKFKSAPCEYLKDKLRQNKVSFVDEYTPISDRAFSIDIAFPDEKIGIEINGNQHYNRDGSLTNYHQERHDIIQEAGWALIEIHYADVYSLNVTDLLNFDYMSKDYTALVKQRVIAKEKNKNKKKYNSFKEYNDDRLKKSSLKAKPMIDIILNSNVDVTIPGWNKKLALILNVRTDKVKHFIKQHIPELYEKCYLGKKRK